MHSNSLQQKVAVVAGGAKNLGGLVSRALAAEGARIVVHYNSAGSRPDADATVAAVKALGSDAFAIAGDLTKPENCTALFDEAVRRFGGVDIAINNVGKVIKKPIVQVTEAEYDEMFAINTKAAFFFIKEAGRTLNDGGKIITLGSSLLAAFTGYYSVYAGAKGPIEHFTRAAAKEFGSRRISVNTVAPGPMDTPFFYGAETPESVAYLKGATMNGELTKIEDIAPLIRFLATEGWWISGQTIFINGGFATR